MGAVVKSQPRPDTGPIAPATVTAVHADGVVDLARTGERAIRAQCALGGAVSLRAGDRVLVATDSRGDHYVIGSMGHGATLRTVDGASASVEGAEGEQVLAVRDAAGRLLFEHRADGRSVIHAPAGDLTFAAEHGRIEFAARDGVKLQSDRDVEIDAGRAVKLTTPHVDARARHAELNADEASVTARTISTTAEKAKHLVGVLETTATRIIERARNAYRETEELSQTKAGRMRLVVKETFHLLGKRTLIRAEKDVRVDGEKIYLG